MAWHGKRERATREKEWQEGTNTQYYWPSHETEGLCLVERRLERERCSRLAVGFKSDRGRAEGRLDIDLGRRGVLSDAPTPNLMRPTLKSSSFHPRAGSV